jgi:two-component system chemotaxis sensor kinase CheA
MNRMDDTIMSLFVEASREQLGGIETALRNMRRDGADIDEELVNTIFRAAHAIKGGAGFLGLGNVRNLARKLENLLYLIRNRDAAPDARITNQLLAGFNRLLLLVEAADASDAEDISELLTTLSELTAEHLTSEQRAQAAAVVSIALPGGEALFDEDEYSLRQAVSGGKNLYLVEYDLVHDVQDRGKTPLDVISTMGASGLIIDCRLKPAAIGERDAPPVDRIPFYVLYATIVEPDIVGYLFALNPKRIHPVKIKSPNQEPPAKPAIHHEAATSPGDFPTGGEVEDAGREEVFGPWRLVVANGRGALRLDRGAPADAVMARRALLAGLDHGAAVEMCWDDPEELGLALLQVMVSAARTFAGRGLPLTHRDGPPTSLLLTASRAGVTPEALADAGVPAHVLFASNDPAGPIPEDLDGT